MCARFTQQLPVEEICDLYMLAAMLICTFSTSQNCTLFNGG